ncbi:MAG: apolipoprotein N-acyltransferase [candidate division NC10 bacterium]|nr:apolipoprotein N-acyltransferase [candidate division NC10 bacterium]
MDRAAKIQLWLLSVLSGILLFLAFPAAEIQILAWIALVPLLRTIHRASPGKGFLFGWVAGMAFYLGSLSWITHAMVVYGGLSWPLSWLVLIALSAYLSSYLGFFSFLCCSFRWLDHLRGLLLLPSLWVCLEFLRNYLLSGFPWNLLGYSQYRTPHVFQLASLTGVYGLSFLILLVNCALAFLLLPSSRKTFAKSALLCAGLALLLTLSYGAWHLKQPVVGERLRVAVVQGNIDQSLKWDPALQRESFNTYRRLTEEVASSRPDLVVWPETALPFYLAREASYRQELHSLVRRVGSPLLVGSPDYSGDGGTRYFNSAFLLSPGSDAMEKYDKMHLVPFGEYVPLRRFLPFLDKLVVGIGDFSPGKEAKIFSVPGDDFGVTICFEAIFPELARAYRAKGAQFLVNITNDAWFGRTAAPYQHLAMATARAVENGFYVVRAANTGISALITPQGRIVHASPLFTEDRFTGMIVASKSLTPYARRGDLFAWACVLVTSIAILGALLPRWARRRGRRR